MASLPADVDISTLSRQELEEHALALRTVISVADAVHRSTHFADLVERIVDAVVTYTRYPSVGLFRVNRAAACVELVAIRGFGEEVRARVERLPLLGSLTGEAVRLGDVVTSNDLRTDGRVEPRTRHVLAKEGFVEVASVPIFFRDDVIGAMNLLYKHAAKLSQHERSTLLAMGKTIGVAMQNRSDAEERRKLEDHLRRAQQLESLGVLAAGLAHEFNNLLVGIAGNVSHARDLAGDADAKAALAEAESASRRAADLAQQLLTFSRGGVPLARPIDDVAELVRESAERAVRGLDVACALDLASDLGSVELDARQFAQVVQNLVLNAAQASPPRRAVQVGLVRLQAPPRLRLTVRDDGEGIAPEHISRIFEPYFTTKSQGGGLGLAIADSIVRRHGGTIHVDSEPGRGTTFIVDLPAVDARSSAPAAQPREERAMRVLIVDDDATVRSVARRILTRGGATVVEAASGELGIAAFSAAREQGRAFDCIIIDLTLEGGEGGVAVLGHLKALDPNVCAIVSSGYSEDAAMARFAAHGFAGVLPKPYTAADLRSAVSMAVQRKTPVT